MYHLNTIKIKLIKMDEKYKQHVLQFKITLRSMIFKTNVLLFTDFCIGN